MRRPAFIAAMLLPLPFAALPLVALLFTGSSVQEDATAYQPVPEHQSDTTTVSNTSNEPYRLPGSASIDLYDELDCGLSGAEEGL